MKEYPSAPISPVEPEIKRSSSIEQASSYWEQYYGASAERPPAQILNEAIKYVVARENACDLGAGTLRDAKFLLDQGFQHVTTVDSSEPYRQAAKENTDSRITMQVDDLELFELPTESFDLVNGQRVFHYTDGTIFAGGFVKKIAEILKHGGIFASTIFSDKDIMKNSNNGGYFPSLTEFRELLENDFEIIKLEEHESLGETIDKQSVTNHVLEVIARRK